MNEMICGILGAMCLIFPAAADNEPFSKHVEVSEAQITWDIKTDVVAGLVRDYLRSKGEVVKEGKVILTCGTFYNSNDRVCRYSVTITVPFDASKP